MLWVWTIALNKDGRCISASSRCTKIKPVVPVVSVSWSDCASLFVLSAVPPPSCNLCFVVLCSGVRESTRLPSFCKLILSVGNFLNYVRIFTQHKHYTCTVYIDRAEETHLIIRNMNQTSSQLWFFMFAGRELKNPKTQKGNNSFHM